MTNKLYFSDPYLQMWEAKIIESFQKDNLFYVVLSDTAFYPEGGGQPSDKGTINEIEILNIIQENNKIYYVLPKMPSGNDVVCKLDFCRRFDLMQQHTGQHLLSAIFHDKYNGTTSSFHLGDDYASIDISVSEISNDMIREVENTVNNYIYKNLEIKTYYADEEQLKLLPLRKMPTVTENIRIVEIDKIDFSPCGGIHLLRLGEIGIIKIIKTEKYKGSTRIYFKCGMRAIKDYQVKNDIITQLCSHFSLRENEILERIKNDSEEIKNLNKELKTIKEEALEVEANNILRESDSKFLDLYYETRSFDDIKLLSSKLLSSKELVIILGSGKDKKIFAGYRGDFDIDFGKIFKDNLSTFNGKGGGNATGAQAMFDNIEEMIKFKNFVLEIIKSTVNR